ncbi:MAG TPA: hypothetical protein VGC93_08500 [Thermoanaerobaculia bacterium]
MASAATALAAVAAGFLGMDELMLGLALASIVLNLLSLKLDGSWVADTEPGVYPPPPPRPKFRDLQIIAVLTMIAGAVAGYLGQNETLLILATVSFAANALSLALEGSRTRLPQRSAGRV